jgi:hypothetical protein
LKSCYTGQEQNHNESKAIWEAKVNFALKRKGAAKCSRDELNTTQTIEE